VAAIAAGPTRPTAPWRRRLPGPGPGGFIR